MRYLLTKSNSRLGSINFEEILFIEGIENYVDFHFNNKK